MEWLEVFVVVAGTIWWSSRKSGVEGRTWRWLFRLFPRPAIDLRLLPRAFAVGIGLGIATAGLRAAGSDELAMALRLVVGSFLGGFAVRSGWWVLVATVTAVTLAAGGELPVSVVALPVALVAFVGTQLARACRPTRRGGPIPSSDVKTSRS